MSIKLKNCQNTVKSMLLRDINNNPLKMTLEDFAGFIQTISYNAKTFEGRIYGFFKRL